MDIWLKHPKIANLHSYLCDSNDVSDSKDSSDSSNKKNFFHQQKFHINSYLPQESLKRNMMGFWKRDLQSIKLLLKHSYLCDISYGSDNSDSSDSSNSSDIAKKLKLNLWQNAQTCIVKNSTSHIVKKHKYKKKN